MSSAKKLADCSLDRRAPLCWMQQMVPMPDSVRLATDIYFPALDGERLPGAFPVILSRTPYNRKGFLENALFFARHGFVVVSQDVRGRFESEGICQPYQNEAADGFACISWIKQQKWCNGRIGTMGSSYCAALQTAAACLNPPGLSTMIVTVGPHSSYHSSMRHNGTLEQRFLVFAFSMAASSKEAAADPKLAAIFNQAKEHVWDYLRSGPIRKGSTPLSLLPHYEQFAIDISTHSRYDEFWQQPGFGLRPYLDQLPNIPTLYVGGWYDTYTRATFENLLEHGCRQTAPVHAIVGPWIHGGVGGQYAGDADFGPEAGKNMQEISRQWFCQWLKDEDHGLNVRRKIDYFLMGRARGGSATPIYRGGTWHSCSSWPPPGCRQTTFFLHPEGLLSSTRPGDSDGKSSFLFDPANPVPTIGGNLSAMPLPGGAFQQINDPRFLDSGDGLPLSARNDILCFVSEPLKRDLVLTGTIKAHLFVSTSAADTDFTVKLLDICPPDENAPGGLAINISDSIFRLRFRQGYDQEVLAQPGKIYEIEFELYPSACIFAKGHRLRVDISSSNYPRFDVNPNSGEPLGQHRLSRKAINTIHLNAKYPSGIVLSVMYEKGKS
jgi:putative CocE/NonD family hydrolase